MIDEQVEFRKVAEATGLNLSISYGCYDNINTENAWKIWLARARLSSKIVKHTSESRKVSWLERHSVQSPTSA